MNKKRVLLLCVIIVVFLLACTCSLTNPVTANPTPTNSPRPTFTSPPTSIPTATSTAEPTTAEGIALPFHDDFSVNQYGWPIDPMTGGDIDTTYSIASGKYRWEVTTRGKAYSCAWPDLPPLSNFTVSVQGRHRGQNPSDNYFGIIYRTEDGAKFIAFAVAGNEYRAWFFDEASGLATLVSPTASDAILPGKVNQLKLVVANNRYRFYANGTKLTSLSDDRIPEGKLGIIVLIYDAGKTTTFEFDNFSVTSP